MSFSTAFDRVYSARKSRAAAREDAETQRQEVLLKLAKEGYVTGPQGELTRTDLGQAEDQRRMMEIDMLNRKSSNALNKLALIDSDQAIQDFTESGDAQDLQNMLNNNDNLKNLWASRGVQQVGNIDWERDTDMLTQAGLKPALYDTPEKRSELNKYWFKISDGTNWSLGSIATMTKETGILKRLNKERRQVLLDHLDQTKQSMTKNAFIQKVDYLYGMQPEGEDALSKFDLAMQVMNKGGEGSAETTYMRNAQFKANATGRSLEEIVTADLGGEKQYEPTREEKLLQFAMKSTEEGGLGMPREEAQQFMTQQTDTTPADVKELKAAEGYTKRLLADFGGEEAFFQTDFNDPKNYRKAAHNITAIEKLEGHEFTNQEKKELNDIRSLIAVSDPSIDLTQEETGLFDNLMTGLKEFVSDEVSGTAARSSYNTFRNSVRHALYGAALTEAEIKSFNEAFGTLGQQLGPVLSKFKTSLTQVKAKLNSIARMKNPYSAYARLGVDQDQISNIISALDERIKLIDKSTKPIKEQLEGEEGDKAKPTAKDFNWFG